MPSNNGHFQTDGPSPQGRLLSIILPAYNEQEVLPQTYDRFTTVCRTLEPGFDYEIIFVNDGSHDLTPTMLDEFVDRDAHVRVVHLTRNFGHQAAITAGLSVARGDAVAIMDCDLQDPPEVLPLFIAQWLRGNQVVYAIRKKRKEWFGKRLAYWAFYRLLAKISDLKIPLDSGDFCLMDRSAVDLLDRLPEKQRFVRGLRTWVGLRQVGVEYERDSRQAGMPQYTFQSLMKLAIDGLVSFSSTPLRFVTRLGLLSAVGAVVIGFWIVGVTVHEWGLPPGSRPTPRGWASISCLILLMAGVQMLSLGIIGEYLARIFQEVKGRPTFLIARISQRQSQASSDEATQAAPVPQGVQRQGSVAG
jgi:glycosyltransferase involved in cell wall biosynthesis